MSQRKERSVWFGRDRVLNHQPAKGNAKSTETQKKNLIGLAFGLCADAKLAVSTEDNSALLENKKQHFQEESLSGGGGQQSHTLSLPLFENAVRGGVGGWGGSSTSACLFSRFIFNGKEVQLLSLFRFTGLWQQLRQDVHIVWLLERKKRGRERKRQSERKRMNQKEQAITVSWCDSTQEALSAAPRTVSITLGKKKK